MRRHGVDAVEVHGASVRRFAVEMYMSHASFRFLAAAGALCMSLSGAGATDYVQSELVSGVPGHGINGLTFGPDGKLYGSSMLGTGFLKLYVSTGVHERILDDQPSGDDLAFSPRGELTWTALRMNEVRQRGFDGVVRAIATDVPWINPIAFAPDGTLYLGQITQPDILMVLASGARATQEKIGGG